MQRSLVRTAAAALLAATAACSDSSTAPAGTSPVRLSFSAGTAAGAARSVGAPSLSVALAAAGDSLVITKASLVVRRIELASADTTACDDASDDDAFDGVDDGRHGDDDSEHAASCHEIEIGPRLVALPVDSTSRTALDVTLPAGSYRFFEAKIRPVRAGDRRGADFLAAHPEAAGASVLVEGTFNGRAFSYKGRVEAGIERDFDPPLVLDSTRTDLAVTVNLAGWFRDGSGRLVDPATANAGGANERTVARNIKRSFHAFEDEDHDGRDDHGGESGHGGGSDDGSGHH